MKMGQPAECMIFKVNPNTIYKFTNLNRPGIIKCTLDNSGKYNQCESGITVYKTTEPKEKEAKTKWQGPKIIEDRSFERGLFNLARPLTESRNNQDENGKIGNLNAADFNECASASENEEDEIKSDPTSEGSESEDINECVYSEWSSPSRFPGDSQVTLNDFMSCFPCLPSFGPEKQRYKHIVLKPDGDNLEMNLDFDPVNAKVNKKDNQSMPNGIFEILRILINRAKGKQEPDTKEFGSHSPLVALVVGIWYTASHALLFIKDHWHELKSDSFYNKYDLNWRNLTNEKSIKKAMYLLLGEIYCHKDRNLKPNENEESLLTMLLRRTTDVDCLVIESTSEFFDIEFLWFTTKDNYGGKMHLACSMLRKHMVHILTENTDDVLCGINSNTGYFERGICIYNKFNCDCTSKGAYANNKITNDDDSHGFKDHVIIYPHEKSDRTGRAFLEEFSLTFLWLTF
jgi:hypothetical protein